MTSNYLVVKAKNGNFATVKIIRHATKNSRYPTSC